MSTRAAVHPQEYGYWIITSHWNLQKKYGNRKRNNKEWTAANETLLAAKNPLGHALLVATLDKVRSPT